MRHLLYKEFRSLLPFLALVIFFASLNGVGLVLTEFPDQYSLSRLLGNRAGNQFIYFIMAFALAAGLLVRERDEGTLSFLDGLPVSRRRIFFCKFALALAVLWLLPLCDFIYNFAVHSLSRTSLELHSHVDLLLTASALDAVACFVYLSLGLALSFLRRFSLLVMGLLFWLYSLLKEIGIPFVPWFDIFSLCEPIYEGQRWLIPWGKLALQLMLAVFCVAIAFLAFQFSGHSAPRLAIRTGRGRALLAGATTFIVIVVWVGLAIYWTEKSKGSNRQDGEKVYYTPWATARANTERYQLLYPGNRSDAVQPLLEHADATEAKVRSFLGAEPINAIVVDLTSIQPRHAGLAYWRKVRMNLPYHNSAESAAELVSVLGHETTHVFIEHLAGPRLSDQFDSIRFFHEGLASYVEYHIFHPTNKLATLRRVAAVMRARDEVKLEELLDNKKLSLKRDDDLAYPLGEVLVAALVKRYGEAAPGKVLRAFARKDAPEDLSSFALWQDTLQACGYNLSDVTATFFAELDREVVNHRSFIDKLPRLRGAVQSNRDWLKVRASYTGEAPGTVVCRFRQSGDTESRFYEMAYEADGIFEVDASDYPERSYWYQLGWMVPDASQIIYEPWVEVRRR